MLINQKRCYLLGSLVFLLIGCTVELDIDLNESDPQIVVEANLSNLNYCQVSLTESVNFDDDNSFPKVENAVVTVSDDNGLSEVLIEVSPGHYSGIELMANSSSEYSLEISVNDKLIIGSCLTPSIVAFDSLVVNETIGGGGRPGGISGTGYEVIVHYSDPPSEFNYYRFVEYKNDVFQSWYIFDDHLSDGMLNKNVLQSFNRNLNDGDVLTIEMQCVSQEVFEYYKSFGNLMGGPASSSTPANPYSNLDGTKLGYFSAHTSELRHYYD
jgi:hypothetical protein